MTDHERLPQRERDREPASRDVPTTDALRHRTDFAGAGDKVPFPDPAMAPLGTDDEAGGRPPSPQERAIAAADQVPSPSVAAAAAKKPDHAGERWAGPLMIAVAAGCGLVFIGAYWFAR